MQGCLLRQPGGDSAVSFLLWGLLGPNYQEAVVFLACSTACPFILNPTAHTGVLTIGLSLGFGLYLFVASSRENHFKLFAYDCCLVG